jgi:hypothetical protein
MGRGPRGTRAVVAPGGRGTRSDGHGTPRRRPFFLVPVRNLLVSASGGLYGIAGRNVIVCGPLPIL